MDAKYKKNYLKQVIVRTDFLNPIHSLNEGLPNEISSVIKEFLMSPAGRVKSLAFRRRL